MSVIVPIATVGHNSAGITDIQILQENLSHKYQGVVGQAMAMCSEANAMPRDITDEETAARFSDLIKGLLTMDKSINSHRESEKEPYNKGGRAVDGFFNPWRDKLSQVKTQLSASLTTWQRQKADEERRRRQEHEQALRAEAERKAAEAQAIEAVGVKEAAQQHFDQAVALEHQAQRASVAAVAKPADLTKARGATGAVASLRSTWVGELISRQDINLEALRPHLPEDAITKAIGSFVRAGGRELAGAKIYEKTETVVR